MKDNSQAPAADHRARRTRRVREKKAASKWLARHSDAPPSLSEIPPDVSESELPPGVESELPPSIETSAESASSDIATLPPPPVLASADAALSKEELAARLEAPTVRPPSNPPAEGVLASPAEPHDDETPRTPEIAPLPTVMISDNVSADRDSAQGDEREREEDWSEDEEIGPAPVALQAKAREIEQATKVESPRVAKAPVVESDAELARLSGLPPKRSGGRWITMLVLAAAVAGAVYGGRSILNRAPKPAPIAQAETPPPPEPKAAPPTPAPAPAPAPVATVTLDPKAAVEEREAARVLLEKRNAKEALPLATRAVEHDPSDAQTWLILGATHQDLGQGVEARDSFLECTKKATTGPIHECRALLSYNGPR